MQPADRESELCVALPADAGAVLRRGAAIFAREVEARGGGRVRLGGPAPAALELALEPGIGPDGFRIAGGPGGRIRVAGNNERGAVYGIGKLLRSGRVESGRFRPGPWRGTSVPAKPVRGLYLATHFHNFYHDAPLGEVEAYIEELALWGFNTLMVWYDMHHFKGFDDPEAVAFRERLARLAGAARGVGMKFGFTIIANEAYADSPPELRADPRAKRGGYYDVAVCPSRPGGLAYIKRVFSQFFEWASDLRPEYLWIWPFDQ